MAKTDFRPILFLLHQCPFCLKLMIYLTEAGLIDRFDLVVFESGSAEQLQVRDRLSPHFDQLSFPVAEVAPGDFRKDSDALIAYFADQGGADPATLTLLPYYDTGVKSHVISLFLENRDLKRKLAETQPV